MALVNAFYQNTAINNIQLCQVYQQKKYNTVSGEVHIIIKHKFLLCTLDLWYPTDNNVYMIEQYLSLCLCRPYQGTDTHGSQYSNNPFIRKPGIKQQINYKKVQNLLYKDFTVCLISQ